MDARQRVVTNVLNEVQWERAEQDIKWGEQNHPKVSGHDTETYARAAEATKLINDANARQGTLGWDGILLEEVYEACAESDPLKYEEEMIQVAAVAVAAVEASRRARLQS